MTNGVFWSSIQETISVLKKVGLFQSANLHQYIPYSTVVINHPQVEIHKDIYDAVYEVQDYDILLDDYSVLQLNIDASGNTRMLYVQNPLQNLSIHSYLLSLGFKCTPEEARALKYDVLEDYNQARAEQAPIASPVYLRYEIDPVNREGNEDIHAYAHLHIGLNNSIRIPFGIDLTPMAFVMFVIRHVYYDIWVDIVRKQLLEPQYMDFKKQCAILPKKWWTDKEQKNLYVT